MKNTENKKIDISKLSQFDSIIYYQGKERIKRFETTRSQDDLKFSDVLLYLGDIDETEWLKREIKGFVEGFKKNLITE